MVAAGFDWHSARSRKARLGRALSGWIVVFATLAVVLPLVGAAMVYVGLAAGWLVVGLAAPLFMVVKWHQYDLRRPRRIEMGTNVDDWLDAEVLSLLPEQPTPKSIVDAIGKTNGGMFFAARFGLISSSIRDLLSDDKGQAKDIFIDSMEIARGVNNRVSAGVLIISILRQIPDNVRQTLLGHLKITEEDILRGVKWYHHIDGYIKEEAVRRTRSGGIGRDWSFGWIPNLSRFGANISHSGSRAQGDIRKDLLGQLAESLSSGGGAVALVGKPGVGKTEIVYELADLLMHPDESVPKSLHYQQVFLLSASRLLSASSNGTDVGGLISGLLGEAYQAKNIIVCLDNAELFMQEGVGMVDLVSVLLPIFEAKRLPIILTLDEQRYLQVAKRTPELATAIRRINVEEPSEGDVIKIMQDNVARIEHKYKVTIMYQALKEAYRLGKRYIYDIVMPGQAVTLIESSAEYAENGLVTTRSVNSAIEASTGIKTAVADDDSEKELLLNLESRLHERMVGQNRAVGVVSDALRRARAGIRNQDRPVGTFLFLGPTGVGKTELAKSLAEVYYGGEENIVRLDMNEFVLPEDVTRLIADGADNPNSLTAQVMKQPFSVVLLDEIEKAHSSVLTTLLQLLDEGVLRDERNREVSFRDTIVIATSNAGASRIQEYIERGYRLDQFEEPFINELIGGHIFHPEFLNRFDEMVVFAPLTKDELFLVVDRILAGVNKTLQRQNISVVVADDAKQYLVDQGYDPRLGARPLRRVVQRAVESTVAKMMLSGEATPGSTVELTAEMVQGIIDTKRQADEIIEGI